MNPYKAFIFFCKLSGMYHKSILFSLRHHLLHLPSCYSKFLSHCLVAVSPQPQNKYFQPQKTSFSTLTFSQAFWTLPECCLPLMNFPMLLKRLLLLPMFLPIFQLMNHFSFSIRWSDREDTMFIFDPWIECTLLNRSWALKAKPQSPWAERRHRGHKMVNWKEDSVVFVGQSSGNAKSNISFCQAACMSGVNSLPEWVARRQSHCPGAIGWETEWQLSIPSRSFLEELKKIMA